MTRPDRDLVGGVLERDARAFEALAAVNARVARMVKSQAPEHLMRQAVDQLEGRTRDFFEALPTMDAVLGLARLSLSAEGHKGKEKGTAQAPRPACACLCLPVPACAGTALRAGKHADRQTGGTETRGNAPAAPGDGFSQPLGDGFRSVHDMWVMYSPLWRRDHGVFIAGSGSGSSVTRT